MAAWWAALPRRWQVRLVAGALAAAAAYLLRLWSRRKTARERRQRITVDAADADRHPVGSSAGRVEALYVYPVKSCRAQSVGAVAVTPSGLAGDRALLIAEERRGALAQVTQRMFPRLAAVEARVGAGGDSVEFSAVGVEALVLRLPPPGRGAAAAVRLHAGNVACEDAAGADGAVQLTEWLTAYLALPRGRRSFRLLRVAPGGHPPELRQLPLVGRMYAAHDRMAFADLAPVLATSTASLDSLNQHIQKGGGVPMDRFRPNVVVGGLPAWLEDLVEEVEVGGVRLRKMMDCTRCVMPTVDQRSGDAGFAASLRSAEPLATLKRVRPSTELLGWAGYEALSKGGVGRGRSPMFGCLLGLSSAAAAAGEGAPGGGELRVGDAVVITKLSRAADRRQWHGLW